MESNNIDAVPGRDQAQTFKQQLQPRHKQYTEQDVDVMLLLRYGKPVESLEHPTFMSYEAIGKLFKCSGTKARQVIMERLRPNSADTQSSLVPRPTEGNIGAIKPRKRFGIRFIT